MAHLATNNQEYRAPVEDLKFLVNEFSEKTEADLLVRMTNWF